MVQKLLLLAMGLSSTSSWGQLQINSALYISAGSSITVANGNVVANAAIEGPGPLVFAGTVQQELNMNGLSADNIEVNNTSGILLTGNATINSLLNFTTGSVTLGANDLTFTATGLIANYTGTGDKYIITDGTGIVRKLDLATNATFDFPVGRAASDYTPASITNLEPGARIFNVQVKNYAETVPIESNVTEGIDRTWQISSDISGSANVVLSHNDVTNSAGIQSSGSAFNPAAAYISQQTSTNVWSTASGAFNGGTPVNTLSKTLTVPNAPDATSYLTKSSMLSSPLPLDILSFDATKSGKNNVVISWTTAFETHVDHFEVERSYNGILFNKVASEVRAKNKNAESYYTVDDASPLQGMNYYRLRIVDLDGGNKTTQVKTVDFNDVPRFTLTPNPATNELNLVGNFTDASIEISSSTGQRLIRQSTTGNSAQVNIEMLPAGTYFVRIIEGSVIIFARQFLKI